MNSKAHIKFTFSNDTNTNLNMKWWSSGYGALTHNRGWLKLEPIKYTVQVKVCQVYILCSVLQSLT